MKTAVFLLPIILVLAFFEYQLAKVPNSYNVKRAYLEAQLSSLEILVMGSSQSAININPQYFSRQGFNLGNISQSIYYDTRLGLKYLPRMPKLKCVILPLSYFSFGYQLGDSVEAWREDFYYQFWDISSPDLKWYDIKRYSKLFLYTPWESLKFARKMFRVKAEEEVSSYGWMQKKERIPINDETGKARVHYWNTLIRRSHYQKNIDDLVSLVKRLRERGIRIVLLSPPVTQFYYRHEDQEINAENDREIRLLCETYGCIYFDYSHDARLTNGDFIDNDHLTQQGAEKFSKILNAEVVAAYGGGI